MRTTLIVNPNAGRGRGAIVQPYVTKKLTEFEIPFNIVKTEVPEQAIDFAYQAAINGSKRVVAIGGDGTCNEVINGLLAAASEGHDTTFGLIPVGSGNDLAYSLGIPTDIEQACLVLKHGSEMAIDIGKVTVDGKSQFFVNAVGLGFDGEMCVILRQTRRLHGLLMYIWSALMVWFFGKWPTHMTVMLDDSTIQQPNVLVNIGNGSRVAGGFLLAPDAKLDDGMFDITVVGKTSRLGLLLLLPRMLKGTFQHHPVISMHRTSHVQVVAKDGMAAHIDGEVLCQHGREFEFEILPKALNVLQNKK